MAKLLLEDSWKFTPDRKNIRVQESQGGILKSHVIPGVLSQCDVTNGNNRRYPRTVWENNTKDDAPLMQLIKRRAAFGLLEHPESGSIDLRSPISHAVTGVKLDSDGILRGEITILDGEGFPDGKKLRGLIEFGYDPLVSSRGYGSVAKSADGQVDEVQADYVCEGWDVVMNPSFSKAQLSPARGDNTITTTESISTPRQNVVVENKGTAAIGQPTTQQASKKIMEINQIRQAVASLGTVDILKASPRVVAESFTQATTLHHQLEEARIAVPTASWDCTKLHEELSSLELKWTGAIQGICEENNRLKSDRDKLVVLSENLAKTCRLYRTQLSDTVQKRNAAAKLYENVAKRGRGWQAIAVHRGQKNAELEHQAKVACAAIDMLAEQMVKIENGDDRSSMIAVAMDTLAEQYHIDTAKLARTIVELKFPTEVAKEEIKKKLEEAQTAEAVLAILNELEKATTTTTVAPAPGAPVTESATGKPNSSANAAATNSAETGQEGITAVLGESIGHTLSFEQAVSVTRRLSGAKSTKVVETAGK